MSSNRSAEPHDAIILHSASEDAPVRLPEVGQEAFVAQFNQIYGAIGLRLEPLAINCAGRPMPVRVAPPQAGVPPQATAGVPLATESIDEKTAQDVSISNVPKK